MNNHSLRVAKLILIIILGFIAQLIIEKDRPFLIMFTFTPILREFLRVGVNIDNLILGLAIWIIIAVYFYKLFGRKLEILIKEKKEEQTRIKSIRRRYIFKLFSIFIICFLSGMSLGLASSIVALKWSKESLSFYSFYPFFLSLLLMAISFWLIDRLRQKKIFSINKRDIFILTILSILTASLLGYNLRFPKEIVADEAASWVTVRQILLGKYQGDMFSYGYYSYPVFNAFLQAGIIKLFHLERAGIAGWRFTAVPIAVVLVWGTYLMGKLMFSQRIGFIAALILMVNPFFMILSRISLPTNQSIVPPLYTLLFLYASFGKESLLLTFLAAVAAGFGFYVYPSGRIAILVGLLYFVFKLKHPLGRKKIFFLFFIYLFSFLLTTAPILAESLFVNPQVASHKLFETTTLNPLFLKNLYPEVSESTLTEYFPFIRLHPQHTLYLHPILIKVFLRNLTVTLISFFRSGIFGYIYFSSSLIGLEWGFFAFLGMFLALIGFFYRGNQERYALLLIWFFVCLIVFGVIWGAAQFWRIEPVLPILAIFSAISINSVVLLLEGFNINKKAVYLVWIFFIFLLCLSGYKYFRVIHQEPPQTYQMDVDLGNAVNDAKEGEVVIYIYDQGEGIKRGLGELFNLLHLSDSPYRAISTGSLETELFQFNSNKKYTFFFEKDQHNLRKRLTDIFGDNCWLKPIKRNRQTLYYILSCVRVRVGN